MASWHNSSASLMQKPRKPSRTPFLPFHLSASHRVGDLRFSLPVSVDPYKGSHDATSFGPACPQQEIDFPHFYGVPPLVVDMVVNRIYTVLTATAEDCETEKLCVWEARR